jgi:hypothetical protein
MIFLRTTSKAFTGSKKGNTFRSNLQQSFQFGGHRAVIVDSAFSYYSRFSAGYTFMRLKETSLVDRWLNQDPIDYDKVAESLFTGIGLVSANYTFDGSGDSGDFSEESITFSDGLNMNTLLNSRGLCDSTDPNHCLHMRSPGRREWRGGTLVAIVGGTRTGADTIEYCANNALEDQYGGWENNAGASGSVHIITGQSCVIDYIPGDYYCDRCDEHYDDDSSCACIKCPECYDYVDEDTNVCECCDKVVSVCKNENCDNTFIGAGDLCTHCKDLIAK